MTPTRKFLLAGAALGFLGLTACSSLPSFNFGNSKAKELAEAEKAGRITMVLSDTDLEANPELSTETITLPPPREIDSWPQAGASAAKVVGHIKAAETLSIAWRNGVGKGSSKKSAISTPPVASKTTVFTLDSEQQIVATDLASGNTKWRKKLKGLSKRDKAALGGGLAVDGDTLIVASGFGYVTALDASTGDEKWKNTMSAPMTGAPTIKDDRIFVESNNNEIFALAKDTGEIEWSDQAISETARVLGSPSPAAVEDFVIAPFSSGEVIAYLASNQSGITIAIDGRSGQRIWSAQIGSVQAPAVTGEQMFVLGTDGKLACLNTNSGEAYWVVQLRQFEKEKKKKKRISYSGPIVASGRVLVVSSTGHLLAYSPQTGEEVGSVKLGDRVYLEPIAVQDKVLVLTDDAKLIAIK